MRNYVGKTTITGHIDIVKSEEAHLPHVRVSWYPGWGLPTAGVCAVFPGESNDAAATRAYPESAHDAGRSVSNVEWVRS